MTVSQSFTPATLLIGVALHSATAAQTRTPTATDPARSGSLRQIMPGHYVYTTNNEGRLFNSGVVATNDGVLVFDALATDAIARAHGPIPDDPKQTSAALDRAGQILVDARDDIQSGIAKGSTEDQAVAAVTLGQDAKLYAFAGQREVVLRRIYRELKGTLQ